MNIETANRLIEYRKKSGLSQDQVAEKIGVSRQAVSKWERAEASPDTDNLIMLSKLYNVSLDELINGKPYDAEDNSSNDSGDNDGKGDSNAPKALHYTDDDGKRIDVEFDDNGINIKHSKNANNADSADAKQDSENNSKSADNACNDSDEPKDRVSFKHGIHVDSKDGDKVHIGLDGIHVHDKNGDKVDVGWNGIHVSEGKANGDKVDIDRNGVFVEENGETKITTDENGNIIVDDEVKQKHKKSKLHRFLNHFPYYAICIIAYIFFGFFNVCGGWAFGWLIFLTIPLYYSLISAIFKRRADHFAYPVLTVLIFLYTGFYYSLWHPMWVVFLTIPIYYAVCDFLRKLND